MPVNFDSIFLIQIQLEIIRDLVMNIPRCKLSTLSLPVLNLVMKLAVASTETKQTPCLLGIVVTHHLAGDFQSKVW